MEITEYKSYAQFKYELDHELMATTEGFIRIGYLLRFAQDTSILAESGYENVNEFAKAEYGLDKSQVSRFIDINKRFSYNGYSDRIEPKYRNYGVAKLGIMIQLTDEINEQLSPDMSKSEINAIKDEYKEEQKITDIEVMLEGRSEDSILKQMIDNILHEHPEIYMQIWDENKKAHSFGIVPSSKDYAEDVLAAAGEAVYTTRVPGVGKCMLTIRTGMEKLIITNMRTSEIEYPEWEELGRILWFEPTWRDAELEWVDKYQEEWPIKAEIKPEKKPSKVVTTPKATPKETEKVPQTLEKTQCEPISEPKTDFMPEPVKNEASETAQSLEKTQCNEILNAPIEQANIEPIEEDIEEVEDVEVIENSKVAPVQQPESLEKTQLNEDLALTEKIRANADIIRFKDVLLTELAEAIASAERNQFVSVESKLEHAHITLVSIFSTIEDIRNEDDEDE